MQLGQQSCPFGSGFFNHHVPGMHHPLGHPELVLQPLVLGFQARQLIILWLFDT